MKPTLTLAASLIAWGRVHDWYKSIPLPRRRATWGFIALAVVLLVALLVSLFFLRSDSRGVAASKCYAEGHFDGINVYLETPHTTMQSCASGAKGAGLTNLSSLPNGVTLVCVGTAVNVYMQPDQVATVRGLGINPASICS